jgi:hypothetical protein
MPIGELGAMLTPSHGSSTSSAKMETQCLRLGRHNSVANKQMNQSDTKMSSPDEIRIETIQLRSQFRKLFQAKEF